MACEERTQLKLDHNVVSRWLSRHWPTWQHFEPSLSRNWPRRSLVDAGNFHDSKYAWNSGNAPDSVTRWEKNHNEHNKFLIYWAGGEESTLAKAIRIGHSRKEALCAFAGDLFAAHFKDVEFQRKKSQQLNLRARSLEVSLPLKAAMIPLRSHR